MMENNENRRGKVAYFTFSVIALLAVFGVAVNLSVIKAEVADEKELKKEEGRSLQEVCEPRVTDGLIELIDINGAQFIFEPRRSEYNFNDAVAECATYGATLPFYNSYAEYFTVRDFINNVIASQAFTSTMTVYMGVQQDTETTLAPLSQEADPEFFARNGEVPWSSFEPRLASDPEFGDICVTANFDSSNGEWAMSGCGQRFALLCRREEVLPCL